VVDALGSFVLHAKGREDLVGGATGAGRRQDAALSEDPSPYPASGVLA
jgi:hypothetical protein